MDSARSLPALVGLLAVAALAWVLPAKDPTPSEDAAPERAAESHA